MKLVDTHCHLDFPDYEKDLDEVIERAVSSGVERFIVPGTSLESSRKAVELSRKYPQVFAAVGIHPHEADKVTPEDISGLRQLASESDKVVAIGEVGLDYYRKYSKPRNQKDLFRKCIFLARELDLPVILHNRNAQKDFLHILKDQDFNILRGVVHCFSGDEKFLKEILSLDLFVSFAGNITFPKAKDLRALAVEATVEKVLLETDSPYISPEGFRGKRNEPIHVRELLGVYEELFRLSAVDVARVTTHNADSLFRLGIEKESTAVYKIRDSLYVNVTYRCTNRCTFCTRDISDYVKGYDLKLDKEPSAEEIKSAIGDVSKYKEIVFCGLGEPTLRLEILKNVASYVKNNGGKVRLTTNGEGDLINGRRIVPEIKGLVDKVSISLNAPDSAEYAHLCRSVFGRKAFESVLAFITECRDEGIEVEITCLDIIGEKGIEKCRKLAEERGASFRLRHLHVVG
ncbi:MAG: YchF/TatD family DNA exonuclease [Candidatus Omnitrophica bacterium]|nr:YchF/TatD family DNA exonuclease [Candidatus Omnitrophota bacterium]